MEEATNLIEGADRVANIFQIDDMRVLGDRGDDRLQPSFLDKGTRGDDRAQFRGLACGNNVLGPGAEIDHGRNAPGR